MEQQDMLTGIFKRVVHAEASPDDGIRKEFIGQSDTRRPVIAIRVRERLIVDASRFGKNQVVSRRVEVSKSVGCCDYRRNILVP